MESIAPTHLDGAGCTKSKAKAKASGTRATAMCYTQMLFALAGDKLVFGVTPDTMSWIGSVLILAGAVWVAAARDPATKDKRQGRDRSSHNDIGQSLGPRDAATTGDSKGGGYT